MTRDCSSNQWGAVPIVIGTARWSLCDPIFYHPESLDSPLGGVYAERREVLGVRSGQPLNDQLMISGSINRKTGIDFQSPGIDAVFQVFYFLKTSADQDF